MLKIRKALKKQKGFTLIELIVVIAILAILAALAVPRLTHSLAAAKTNTDEANLRMLNGAVSLYYADNGSWPTQASDLVDTYLDAIPESKQGGSFTYDATTHEFSYTAPAS